MTLHICLLGECDRVSTVSQRELHGATIGDTVEHGEGRAENIPAKLDTEGMRMTDAMLLIDRRVIYFFTANQSG